MGGKKISHPDGTLVSKGDRSGAIQLVQVTLRIQGDQVIRAEGFRIMRDGLLDARPGLGFLP
jgi:hypothetical protein